MPTRWQNFTLSASPPCSPQIPIFSLGRVLRPRSNGPFDQHADAGDVERLERVRREYCRLCLVHVVGQEAASIIARKAHGGLRQVVGAERKELGDFGNLVREQRGARQLDHGAD